MIIYRLLIRGTSLTNAIDKPDPAMTHIKPEDVFDSPDNLVIDQSFMLGLYNVEISDTEIVRFRFHRKTWLQFLNSPHSWCLILENDLQLNASFEELSARLSDISEEPDLMIPCDESYLERNRKFLYDGGFYAYFLNKSGVRKLLNIAAIKQPLDEEILTLKNFNIGYIQEGSYVQGEEWAKAKREQQASIRKSIFSRNVWSAHSKNIAREILTMLSDLCTEFNFDLILDSGTLLAHIRHGEIMRWDDDFDFAICEDDLESFLQALDSSTDLKYGEAIWKHNGTSYYKVWTETGDSIEDIRQPSGYHKHKFPFIDVWIFSKSETNIVFRDGRIFDRKDFYPLVEGEFEQAKFKIPLNTLNCLDTQYNDWSQFIRVDTGSHRLERRVFFPLSTSILVDEKGRIIG